MKTKSIFLTMALVTTCLLSGCSGLTRSVIETDLGDSDNLAKSRLKQHVYTLASDEFHGRAAGSEYAQMAADYIVNQFTEIGIKPYFGDTYLQPFNMPLSRKNYQNIVGIIRGNDPDLKDEYIVVGAHYDAIGSLFGIINNGADDNASGTAALIELAQELKRNESELGRSVILIAFDHEEAGIHGSTHFIFDPQAPLENIKLMIGIDMIGYYQAYGAVKYFGTGTIQKGNEIILNPEIIPEGLNVSVKEFESHPLSGTDTWPFALRKIPTLFVQTGTIKSPYHTPSDEAHLLDYDGMTLITTHLKDVVLAFSRDSDYEASGKIAQKHRIRERMRYGVSANLGHTYHDYTVGGREDAAFSFGAGLMSQINFGVFGIRPEIYYDRIQAYNPSGTTITNNITVPLTLILQTPVKFFNEIDLFAGGYYSYRFDGKQGNQAIDFEKTFTRHEGGITFGWDCYLKPIKFGQTWRIALTDFTRFANADNAHIRNITTYATITYTF